MTKTYIKKPKLKFKKGDRVYFRCKITDKPIRGIINSLSVIVRQEREGYGAIVNQFRYHVLYNNEKINQESNTSIDIDKVFSSLQDLQNYYEDCIEIDYEIGQTLYDFNLKAETIEDIYLYTNIDSKYPYHVTASTDKCCNRLLYEKNKKCNFTASEKSMFTLEEWQLAMKNNNIKNN